MEWHVVGVGAIGGLFACRMQAAGIKVFACPSPPRPTQAPHAANATVPLVLEEPTLSDPSSGTNKTEFTIPLDSSRPIQRLLLTTKAQQSLAAMDAIQKRLQPDSIVVVLQNGMGIHELLRQHYPSLKIVAGSTTEGANRITHEHIRHAGVGTTWLGAWDTTDQAALDTVFDEWRELAIHLEKDPAIRQRLWEKLAINCAINPLTALLDCPNGELLSHEICRQIMRDASAEVAMLMQHAGLNSTPDALYQTALSVAERTQANISSMLQDRRAKRETEIQYINGYAARYAQQHGLQAPINRWLCEQVQAERAYTFTSLAIFVKENRAKTR
ncbi:2-dehydropantoate 2-reductase (Ketopantoate reductase) [gamma proteobacterium HdN1]|nr:2-dehydropantoate 2-reductase (Ketopantoate reductase) [gamma proteobacterium HdN1]